MFKDECMSRDKALDYLLELNGAVFVERNGYWHKIEVRLTDVAKERPHGISYCLTLHNEKNERVFGMDNAHSIKSRRKGYKGRIVEYDHLHADKNDRGTVYVFMLMYLKALVSY
jgi:hypothetical protein